MDLKVLLKKTFTLLTLATALILIATYMLALAMSPVIFAIVERMSECKLVLEILPPYAGGKVSVPLFIPFIVAWAIFVICIIYSFKGYNKELSFIKVLEKALDEPKAIFNNFLLAMPFISSATITLVIITHVVQEQAGIPVGTPPEVDYAVELLGLSYATILEEVCFRLLPIGIPLIFALIFAFKYNLPSDEERRANIVFKGILRPKYAVENLIKSEHEKKLASVLKTLLIAWSALTFGLLHYSMGDWQIGKVLPTTIAGLVLAYCYIEYGIEASILIHWIFNVYLTIYSLASAFVSDLFSQLTCIIMLLTTTTGAVAIAALAIHIAYKTFTLTKQAKIKT